MNTNNHDLKQKIGQMMTLGFQGAGDDEPAGLPQIIELAGQGLIGGVIFYGYNVVNPGQLQRTMERLESVRAPHPLFIFVDQEGGKVQRLNQANGFRDFLSAKCLATRHTPQQAFEHYQVMGKMLREAGFNFNFAPCVDLDYDAKCEVIGGLERSYGDDPQLVAEYAEAMIDGLSTAGIRTCLKHFPGHGNASGDSHKGMVEVTETWQERELSPYRNLIAKNKVDAVMTAHIIHQGIDPDTPATLSRTWIKKLREGLGFEGLIISDDLHMGAILQNYGLEDAVVSAVKAGLDLLIFSNNPMAAQGVKGFKPDSNVAEKAIRAIFKAIENGGIAVADIEAAYNRIVSLKKGV